jgi:hypothetical protein
MDAQQASNDTAKKPPPAKRKRATNDVSSPVATPQKSARVKKRASSKQSTL